MRSRYPWSFQDANHAFKIPATLALSSLVPPRGCYCCQESCLTVLSRRAMEHAGRSQWHFWISGILMSPIIIPMFPHTAIEHIKKNFSSPLSGKNKTKNKSAQPADDESNDSDTCPMIPIHISATIHKLNCFIYAKFSKWVRVSVLVPCLIECQWIRITFSAVCITSIICNSFCYECCSCKVRKYIYFCV